MSLLQRLILIVLLAMLPIAALDVHNAMRLRANETAQVANNVRRLLALVEGEHARVVDGIRNVLATLRQTRAVRDGDLAACQTLMDRLRGEYPGYLEIFVLDRTARIRCATATAAVGIDGSDRDHVRAALGGRPFGMSPSVVSRSSGRLVLPFSVPIQDDTGAIIGAVVASLDVDWLHDFLAQKPLAAGAAIVVADSTGTVLARLPRLPNVVGTKLSDSYLARLGARVPGMVELPGMDGVPRLLAYSPPTAGVEGLFIAVGVDKAAALAPIDAALARSLAMLLGVLVATAAATVWMGQRHLRAPLRLLTQTARRWHAGDLSARARIDAPDLAPLATQLNSMADALAARGHALAESEARHRAIFETAVDCLVVIDEGGIIQSVNPAAERTFGYAADELLGRTVAVLMPETHAVRHATYMRNYLETGERRIIGIGRGVEGRRKDGTLFPLDLSIAEWRDGQGRRFFTGIMRDTTARRQVEATLEARTERLRLLADLADRLLTAEDPDAALRLVVSGAPAGLGLDVVLSYQADEVARTLRLTHAHGVGAEVVAGLQALPYGQLLCGQVAEERRPILVTDIGQSHLAACAASKRLGFRSYAGFPLIATDGRLLGVLGFASRSRAVLDADDFGLLATIAHHIAAVRGRLAADEALRTAKHQAEDANQAKSRFFAAASHDLRQPVQAMTLFAGVLERQVADGPSREALLHLTRGLDALKAMLDGLLDVTRLEAGAIVADVQVFDIGALLGELAAAYATVAETKGLSFEVRVCPAGVRSDRVLLGRMLRNMLENAIRYTEPGGTVRLECACAGETVRLSVVDTGVGIPKSQQQRIFDEFHQVANMGRNREEGLGLGLAIVKRLSRLLDHPVQVHSDLGIGSRFVIDVPGAPLPMAEPAPARDAKAEGSSGGLALVVDDDAIVLLGLKQMLESLGYEVVIAADPEQAESRIAAGGRVPDLVLTDYRLRGGRVGTEAVSRVRSVTGTAIPGFMLTGEAGPEAAADASAHGLGLLHKPVTPRQLARALETLRPNRAA